MSTTSALRLLQPPVTIALTDGVWSQPMQGNGIRGLQ